MKKHILFIVENNTFPSDTRVWREAKVAKKCGFRVSAISPINNSYRKKYEIVDGMKVYRHSTRSKMRGKLGFFTEYLNAFVYEFLLSIKIFLKRPFHVIHAANPPDFIFLIALFYRIIGVKFIFDHHDLAPELYLTLFSKKKDLFYRIQYLFEKLSCKSACAVISSNKSYKKIVVKRHKINPQKVFVVRNDPVTAGETFAPEVSGHNGNGKKSLLFLGTINPQDGIDVLIKSLYHLVNHFNEKQFVCNILGRGDSFALAKQMTKTLGLESYVDFKGFVPDKAKVKNYLSSSDICLEPAPYNFLNRHSTFIKVMEYMQAGKPIVAFDLKETRYSTGGNAILIKEGDIVEFARAIQRLMANSDLRSKLGKAGQKRILEKLNWENTSLNLEKAYRSIQ